MSPIDAGKSTIQCSRCGYDLRGSVVGEGCPECGLPINASLNKVRVEGKYLIVQDDTILPNRCVKTNEVVEGKPTQKTLHWSHPALLLLILVNLLIFLIVVLVVRKKCRITYYLSEDEVSKRQYRVMISVLLFFGGIGGCIPLFVIEQYWAALACMFLGLAGLIAAAIFNATLKIAKVKKHDIWISGACPEFLESIKAEYA